LFQLYYRGINAEKSITKRRKPKFDKNISAMTDIILKRLDELEKKIDALADSEIEADIDIKPIIVIKDVKGML